MSDTAPAYRLVRPPVAVAPVPVLDPQQAAVVAHAAGPLLVLAGPGTGKTTTMVEAVVRRVEQGMAPEDVLVLTFSRKAADELRGRIASRLGRTVTEPAAHTFHGFCYGVLRRYATGPDQRPPRLLSGAERELRVRELLDGNSRREGRTRWPTELAPALRLRGFAREVADLLDRSRERGIDGPTLARLGAEHGRPAWEAAGVFLDEYLDVLAIREEVDYAGLIGAAIGALDGPARELSHRFPAVYVDEYQDTDPSQEQLLHRLAGGGRLLVAVGDPDQSIYGFRGADVHGILEFPDRFPAADGTPAPVVALRTCRRSGAELLDVSRAVAARIPLGPLTRRTTDHRELIPAGRPSAAPPEIRLYSTATAQVSAIADLLRRAHLEDGLPWSQMAVLVRSGTRSIPVVRRALVAAGVPVSVAADEIPLSRDPAVAPLLAALSYLVDKAAKGARGEAAELPVETARMLLLSPLGGASPAQLRALGRRLRALARAGGEAQTPPSSVLVRDAVVSPVDLTTVEEWVAAPVARLAALLAAAESVDTHGGAPEEVLWALWDGSGWARRLTTRARGTGTAARAADRDLDAVLALFEAASRLEDRQPRAGIAGLLEELRAQEIPAAPFEERGGAVDTVRLLTAHRSKGLEWDLVVVADVQDGVWPDLRRRGSLLEADRLDIDGPRPVPTSGSLLTDERRLFYVALTRARTRLVVTAVSGVDDLADRPSRFLAETGLAVPERAQGHTDVLSPASLVARLRRTVQDPTAADPLRAEAARRLAALADATDDRGVPLLPSADPRHWWGTAAETVGAQPVRPTETPVTLSGSAVASFTTCPRAWFLDREAKARETTTSSQGFGSVVHALAEAVAVGTLPAELDALVERLDTVWPALPFDAPWQRVKERQAAVDALQRFLTWQAGNPRELAGAELAFEVPLGDDIVLRGRADRLELDDAGRVVIVDLKTSKYPPTGDELAQEPQLGVYQLAVREGGFAGSGSDPGGAELLQLRKSAYGKAKVQPQPALDPDDPWADDLVHGVAAAIRTEAFPARPEENRCKRCPFRTSCPARDSGRQVVS
ncbi:MAG TPA: ATP-dependent DNA helicase [Mycobacteriales bacterium]|nr:ATP-dependent DNA helicase [Mycobacteriales bacterium]